MFLPQNNFYQSFCRCVVLSDPLKDSSRSQESWNAFLTKLRTLLLMSFTKNLGKFEDDMRTLREKRTEPGWSFCEYFMVQVRVFLLLLSSFFFNRKKVLWVWVLIMACLSCIFNALFFEARGDRGDEDWYQSNVFILASLKRLCTQAYCKESVMNVNCNKHKIHLENIVNSG